MLTLFAVAGREAILFAQTGDERLHVVSGTPADGLRGGVREVAVTVEAAVAQLLELADVWLRQEDALVEDATRLDAGPVDLDCAAEAPAPFPPEIRPDE